jgi:hypothetical protein
MSFQNRRFWMLKLFPVFFTLLSSLYWLVYRGLPLVFFCYLLFIPATFALIVVVLAGKLRLWQWSDSIWAPVAVWCGYGSLYFLLIGRIITEGTQVFSLLECALSGAFVWGSIATLFDVFAMDAGLITVFNRAHYKKLGTITSVGSYGFYFFGCYGLISGLLAKFGYFFLVESPAQVPVVAMYAGAGLLISGPFTVYVLILSRGKRKSSVGRVLRRR